MCIYFWLCWGFTAVHQLSVVAAGRFLLVVVPGLLLF